ncbi:hypothetical protein KKH24_01460 [Patescibacteria group bacterium]|nr:hypothetical protein [Patescibacteria group bacterium]
MFCGFESRLKILYNRHSKSGNIGDSKMIAKEKVLREELSILVIDDMEAGTCIQNLTAQGVLPKEIDCATSYKDAENKLKNGNYDLSLIDGRLDEHWHDCEGKNGGNLSVPEDTLKVGISGQGKRKGENFKNYVKFLPEKKKAILDQRIEFLERAKKNIREGFERDSAQWVIQWSRIKGLKYDVQELRNTIEELIAFYMEELILDFLENPEKAYKIFREKFFQ